MSRDAVTREQATAALQAQASRQARLAIADDVVVNTGNIAELERQVASLHETYRRQAQARALDPPRSR
jgi:dephospho-CoA kinase